jgi:hypothetical protein
LRGALATKQSRKIKQNWIASALPRNDEFGKRMTNLKRGVSANWIASLARFQVKKKKTQ